MGARELPYDARDLPALLHPGIAATAAAPLPRSATDLLAFIKEPRLDQGQEGSCSCFSTDGTCQISHSQADGSWPAYNGHELYAEAGGVGDSGANARTVLDICVKQGVPMTSGGRDSIIKSYLFLDATPGAFRTQAKAALVLGHPLLIASLVPIPFGWKTGMALSTGYHQYDGVAFETDSAGVEWLLIMNSWGDFWPGDAPAGTPKGVGRISFDCLEQNAMQNGYTYGIVPTELSLAPPVPVPPVPIPPVPIPPIPIPPVPIPPVPVPPPNTLTLQPSVSRYGALAVVVVKLVGPQGQALNGIVTLSVGGQTWQHIAYTTRPAVFIAQQPAGTTYGLSATAGALSATASGTLP
jgi:hypothetical protein